MSSTRTALVIGGGIAGPVAAMALQKAGIEATVYEAYDSTADGVGGGLSIAPNGLNALAVLDADEPVRRIGTPMTGDGHAELDRQDPGRVRQPARPAGPAVRLAPRAVPGAARRGGRPRHPDRARQAAGRLVDDGAAVTATFADGTTATADILLGADGIRSTVRGLIDPAAPAAALRRPGQLRRPAAPGTGARVDRRQDAHGLRQAGVLRLPGRGRRQRRLVRQPAQPRGSPSPRPAPPRRRSGCRMLATAFAGDRSPAAELVRRTDPAELLIVGPMEDIPTVRTWSRGRVVLIGDAAHATSPSSGQGASLADRERRTAGPLPARPAAPAGVRRLRAAAPGPGRAHHRDGRPRNSDKAAGPVARVLRDALMPVIMKLLAKPGEDGLAVRLPDRLGRPGHRRRPGTGRPLAVVAPGSRAQSCQRYRTPRPGRGRRCSWSRRSWPLSMERLTRRGGGAPGATGRPLGWGDVAGAVGARPRRW